MCACACVREGVRSQILAEVWAAQQHMKVKFCTKKTQNQLHTISYGCAVIVKIFKAVI